MTDGTQTPTIAAPEAGAVQVEQCAILEATIDRMGWPEIHAFQAELRRGQDVCEDAGGFMLRAIKALFGIQPRNPVLTYQDAARAMIKEATDGDVGGA